eukprot:COSAG04_NODE_2754_length_3635_cov_14.900643_2_plen_82_part_00
MRTTLILGCNAVAAPVPLNGRKTWFYTATYLKCGKAANCGIERNAGRSQKLAIAAPTVRQVDRTRRLPLAAVAAGWEARIR